MLLENGKRGKREHEITNRVWFEKMRQAQAFPLPLPFPTSSGNRGLSLVVVRMPASCFLPSAPPSLFLSSLDPVTANAADQTEVEV